MGRIGLRAASVLLTFLWVTTGPAQDRFPNIAATSQLPHGAGLAQAFPGDRGIEQAADVIFAEDFESDDWRRKWAEIRDPDEAVLSLVDESATDARLGHHSLRVQATLGNNTGGGVTTWFESADTIHVRFYVKFAADCDYVHHFCTLRQPRTERGGSLEWLWRRGTAAPGRRTVFDRTGTLGQLESLAASRPLEHVHLLARDAGVARRQVLGQ